MLRFDSSAHAYLDGEKRLPSVTGILRDVGYSPDYSFAKEVHRMRGTSVHEAAQMIMEGGWPKLSPLPHPYNKDPEYVKVHGEIPGYWEAIRRAREILKIEGRAFECAMADPVRGYAGKWDGAGTCHNENWFWDWKSGTMPFSVVIQLAAYWDLIERGIPISKGVGLDWVRAEHAKNPFKRKAIRLEKDGKWTLYQETTKGTSFDDPKWISAWRSAMYLHRTVPNHKHTYENEYGRSVTESRLSDLKWTLEAIKQALTGKQYDTAMRAGQNVWTVREEYGLL